MEALYSDLNGIFDLPAVCDRMEAGGVLEKAGGTSYIASLDDGVSSAHLDAHITTVRENANLRAILGALSESVAEIQGARGAPRAVIEATVARVSDAFTKAQAETCRSFTAKEIARAVMEKIERGDGGASAGIETGFADLDYITGGLKPGQLVILAGRPSMGKTTLALNVLSNACISARLSGMMFSMESSAEEISVALLAMRSGVTNSRIRRGIISAEERSALSLAEGYFGDAPVVIDDSPRLSIMDIQARAKIQHIKRPLDVVFVDHIQIARGIGSRKYERRDIELAEISAGLKALAKDLGCPVVALSQLNRKVEDREEHAPRLSDLRESGAIEQDADVVILMHRPGYYNHDAPIDAKRETKVAVAKNRYGATGDLKLRFNFESAKFVSWDSSA